MEPMEKLHPAIEDVMSWPGLDSGRDGSDDQTRAHASEIRDAAARHLNSIVLRLLAAEDSTMYTLVLPTALMILSETSSIAWIEASTRGVGSTPAERACYTAARWHANRITKKGERPDPRWRYSSW